MVASAPRLSHHLLELVRSLDQPGLPTAEVWRRACMLAEACGATRPSYEHVRRLVTLHRELGSPQTHDFEWLLELAFRTRSPRAIVDELIERSATGRRPHDERI